MADIDRELPGFGREDRLLSCVSFRQACVTAVRDS
jgi:hypothetical protein